MRHERSPSTLVLGVGVARNAKQQRNFVYRIASRHPRRSPPPQATCDPLLPFGTDTTGHAWLHRACWSAWYRARPRLRGAYFDGIRIQPKGGRALRPTRGNLMSNQETIRPKPSDYGIEISDPEIAQALADLVETGLVVDSGQRRIQNGK
jgi:hypothetical protein